MYSTVKIDLAIEMKAGNGEQACSLCDCLLVWNAGPVICKARTGEPVCGICAAIRAPVLFGIVLSHRRQMAVRELELAEIRARTRATSPSPAGETGSFLPFPQKEWAGAAERATEQLERE